MNNWYEEYGIKNPYYLDEWVCIVHGDCREILPLMPEKSVDLVLTDPPYGEYMGYAGDNGYSESLPLLEAVARSSSVMLSQNKFMAIFWTMKGFAEVVDIIRTCGLTYRRVLIMYLPKGSARPYLGWLPRTQPIILAQKYLPCQPTEFHTKLAEHISQCMITLGLSRSQIARILGCDSRLVMKWSRVGDSAWCLPTPRFYSRLKELLHLDDRWDVLIDREPAQSQASREFDYRHDCYIVDKPCEDDIGHPSVKPMLVIKHIIDTLTNPSELVVDPFLGSGTTAFACKILKRHCIGIEIEEKYCEIAANRCCQGVFDFRGAE